MSVEGPILPGVPEESFHLPDGPSRLPSNQSRPPGIEIPIDADVNHLISPLGTSQKKSVPLSEGIGKTNRVKSLSTYSTLPMADCESGVMAFFQRLCTRVARLFRSVSKSQKLEINSKILSSVVRASDSPMRCERSIAMDYLKQHLQESGDHDQEIAAQLDHCLSFTRQVEDLQAIPDLKYTDSKITKLVQNVTKRARNLSGGDKMLIPGGWYSDDNVFHDALYEIVRGDDNKYTVRVIALDESLEAFFVGTQDLDDKLKRAPVLEFRELEFDDVKQSITPLIQLQLPQLYNEEQKGRRGFIGRNLDAVEKMVSPEDNHSEGQVQLTPLHVMTSCYEKQPEVPSEEFPKITFVESPTTMKTLFAYLKVQQHDRPEVYKAQKLQVEIQAFFQVYEESEDLLDNSEMRDLIHSSALKLFHELSKLQQSGTIEETIYTHYTEQLTTILGAVQSQELASSQLHLPQLSTSHFEGRFALDHTTSLSKFGPLPPSRETLVADFPAIDFKGSVRLLSDVPEDSDLSDPSEVIRIITNPFTPLTQRKKIALEAIALYTNTINDLFKEEKDLKEKAKTCPPEDRASIQDAIRDLKYDIANHISNRKGIFTFIDNMNTLPDLSEKSSVNLIPQLQSCNAELQEHIIKCQKLYDAGDYATLQHKTLYLISQIPNSDEYWHTLITSNADDPEKLEALRALESNIHQLHQFLFDCHCMLPSTPPVGEAMIAISKLQVLSYRTTEWINVLDFDNVLQGSPDDETARESQIISYAVFRNIRFDPSTTMATLRDDTYFRAIPAHQQKEARQIIKYLDRFSSNDAMIKISPEGASLNFEKGKLSEESIHQRDIFLASQAMLHGNHTLGVHGSVKEVLSAGIKAVASFGGSADGVSQAELWQTILQDLHRRLEHKLAEPPPSTKRGGRAHMQWKYNKGSLSLQPSGIVYDPNMHKEWIKWHGTLDTFRDMGRHIDQHIHSAIATFHVGTEDLTDSSFLTQQSIFKELGPEQEQWLRALQTKDGTIRLEQTYALFAQHPELLDQGQYQRIFELNLFRQNVLLEKLRSQPEFADKLASFINDNLEIARSTNNTPRILFLLDLSDHLQDYMEIAGIDDETIQDLPNAKEEYTKMIDSHVIHMVGDFDSGTRDIQNLNNIKTHYLSLVARHVAAGKHPLEEITDEEVTVIVNYYINIQSHSKDQESINPEAMHLIKGLILKMHPQIQQLCETTDFVRLKIGGRANQPIKGTFPIYHCDEVSINMITGIITRHGRRNVTLPATLEKHPHLQHVLPAHKKGIGCQLETRIDKKTGLEVQIYHITEDLEEDLTITTIPGQDPIIHSRIGRKWYELTPFPNPDTSKEGQNKYELPRDIADLVGNNLVWRDLSSPKKMIVHNSSGELLYEITLKEVESVTPSRTMWSVDKVTRRSDGLELINPWSMPRQALGQIVHIEDPSHILVWGKGSKPQEIQFPRMIMSDNNPLTYYVGKGRRGSLLVCQQHKGFILPLKQAPLRSMTGGEGSIVETLPLTFRHCHVLVNADQKTKVLIPLQQLRRGSSSSQAMTKLSRWSDLTTMDHRTGSLQDQALLEFDVDPQRQNLTSKDKTAMLYLAYTFFAHKRYEEALEYLRKSDTSLSMTGTHRELYAWIEEWPDETPEGNAVKIHAALALQRHKNAIEGFREDPESNIRDVDNLSQRHLRYEKSKSTLPSFLALSGDDETLFESSVRSSLVAFFESKKTSETSAIAKQEVVTRREFTINHAQLAAKLWIDTPKERANLRDLMQLPLSSNKFFIQGFRTLYEKLYNLDPLSPEYKQLKRRIMMSNPQKHFAKASKEILLKLMTIKEELNKDRSPETPYNDSLRPTELVLPREFLGRSRFHMRRLASGESKYEPLEKLLELIDKKSSPQDHDGSVHLERDEPEPTTPPSEPSTPQTLSPRSKRIKDKETIEALIREGDLESASEELQALEESKAIEESRHLDEDGPAVGESPDDVLRRLHETDQLCKLAQKRRVTELSRRKKQIIEKLPPIRESAPPRPLPPMEETESVLIGESHIKLLEAFHVEDKRVLPTEGIPEAPEESSATVKRLVEEYRKDTLAFTSTPPQDVTLVGDINELRETIGTNLSAIQEIQQSEERQILKLLQRTPSARHPLAPKMQRIPERLIGLYVDGKISEANKLYGLELDERNLKLLENLLENYMLNTVSIKLLSNIQSQLKGKKALDPTQAKEVYSLLTTKRSFTHEENPYYRHLLSIEFFNGFVLRPQQVSTIQSMLANPKAVKQLEMGGGKTSVILPFLLRQRADGEHMALGIIPEWLYEIVGQDLDHSCRELFGQDVIRFEFDRSTPMDKEWLLRQYTRLGNAILDGDVVITTKTNLLSFRNKFIELSNSLQETSDLTERIEIFKQMQLVSDILVLLQRSQAIADEIDVILDPRQELNYGVGIPVGLDATKSDVGIDIYTRICAWVNEAEPKCTLARTILENRQESFTPEDIANIQQYLAEEFFGDWRIEGVPQDAFIEYICSSKPSEEARAALSIEGEPPIPKFMLTLRTEGDPRYQQLQYLRQYVSQTITSTLTRSCDVHYGRLDDDTIPYKASNTPSDAEFGEDFEKVAYYVQDYMQKGLSQQQVHRFVKALLSQISNEMYDIMVETGKMGRYEDTPTYKQFQRDFPEIDLTTADKDPALLAKLHSQINNSSKTKMDFLRNWIFPTLRQASKQVSSNAHDLVEVVGEFGGFTGTSWNLDTYHSALDTSDTRAVGTDGKSIAFLTQAAAAGQLQIRTVGLDPASPLESITSAMPDFMERYDSFIDAGAYLKGVGNSDVAAGLSTLGKPPKRAVAFVDESGQKVIKEFSSDRTSLLDTRTDVAMHERISFYDQGHTIGTHMSHTQKARAAVTISEHMYVKDLLQSIWRMRKLGQGQQIDFIISKEVENLIKEARDPSRGDDSISIEDILYFCIKNQAERESEDNLRAQKQKIMGMVPRAMFHDLVQRCHQRYPEQNQQEKAAREVAARLKTYHPHLLRTVGGDGDTLAAVFGRVASADALTSLKDRLFQVYTTPPARSTNPVSKYLMRAVGSLKRFEPLKPDKLPPETEAVSDDAQGSQVQAQRQQQQQISIEMRKALTSRATTRKWTRWEAKDAKDLWDQIGDMHSMHTTFPGLFNENIRYTNNFFPQATEETPATVAAMLAGNRNPVYHVLVMKENDSGEIRSVMIDIEDYEQVVAKLVKPPNSDFQMAVYDIRKPMEPALLRSSANRAQPPWDDDEDAEGIAKMLVQLKFFSGVFDLYSKQERTALHEWISSLNSTDREELRRIFTTRILPQNKAGSYTGSVLSQMLEGTYVPPPAVH